MPKEKIQVRKDIGRDRKPFEVRRGSFSSPGRRYSPQGIIDFIQQQGREYRITYNPPSLEKEINALIEERSRRKEHCHSLYV